MKVGSGVTGAVRYVLGEGKDRKTGEYRVLEAGEPGRVAWIGGTGFGFEIRGAADADLARRIMEFDALNQASPTRRCEKDCVHLALGWPPDQAPTRAEMEEAARGALKALGMENAKAIWAAHSDESYSHLHIVASKINPETGRAYDLKGNFITLSKWAEQYERDHGGVICLRREGANALRQAIDARDAGAVLAALTEQRATFTAADLERALGKQVKGESDRAQFAKAVLGHPEVVALADRAGGPTTRFTTRTVLAAELHVLRAAQGLAGGGRHQVDEAIRDRVLHGETFRSMTGEQAAAFRHATGHEGLSLIDGQAGTGKSYAMAAIREAYEASGYRVIGLGPTNVVAQAMQRDGFGRASTAHSELFALNNGRTSWDRRTCVMVDEAAMLDTRMMAMTAAHAHAAGAKLILVGDDRQLSSIERGGMFGVLKDRYGAAELSEVRRQHKNDDRRAAEMMAEGNFHDALGIYQARGAITWTRTQNEARAALVEAWARDSAAEPGKSRFVFAYTNDDVARLNADIRAVRRQRGELGDDHPLRNKDGMLAFAVEDRIQFTATDKKQGLFNGAAGTVLSIEGSRITVRLDGRAGELRSFDSAAFPEFRHGYAGTIYKGQGRTLDQTYLYHSEHWRSAASYVALTRHQDKAELFVATNTAADARQLARQMARVEERRAASHFHQGQEAELEPPLTPQALMAELGLKPAPPIAQPTDAKPIFTGRDTARSEPNRESAGGPRPMASEPIEDPAVSSAEDPEQARKDRLARAQEDERKRRQDAQKAGSRDVDELARENLRRQVGQAEALEQLRERMSAFEADLRRQADEARDEEARKRAAEAKGKQAEGEIRDAGDRYRVALGDHYDVTAPYSSLSRAAMAEYGAFIRDREQLSLQIAKEKDAEIRKALELRKEIEAADYMTITSHRIAGQSVAITSRRDSEEAVRFRERAGEFEAESRALREQLRDVIAERELRSTAQPGRTDTRSAGDAPRSADDNREERIARIREEGRQRRQAADAAQPESSAKKEAKAAEDELTKGEMTDDKATRIARIREQGREFRSAQEGRQSTPQGRGGGDGGHSR
jgi:hypothetical protein